MKDMYIVYSGTIFSENDGDKHLVTASQVAELHNLKRTDWILGNRRSPIKGKINCKGELFPRYDGKYEDLSCQD